MTGPETTYDQAVWSWTQHLRGGGSVSWRQWHAPADARVPERWTAAGAAQLELVRRLAERGGELSGFSELADLVLARPGPGRGLAQQSLTWGDGASPRFGPPPVDPADIPVEELLRLGGGVLAELLLRAPGPSTPRRTEVRRRLVTRSPAFVLDGAPVTASAVRRDLAASDHAEGGRSPRVVLFAEPVDRALWQAWSVRVQHGRSPRWHGFVDRHAARGELPTSVDVATIAERWARRLGRERVHVVVAPTSSAEATTVTADLLGVTLRPRTRLGARWSDLEPAAVDVLRRVNGVLGVRAGRDDRLAAVHAFLRLFDDVAPTGHRLTVPARHQAWARAAGEQLADRVAAGGYPVHGRLEELLPNAAGIPSRPRPHDALRVMLWACLRQATTGQAGEGSGDRKVAT